MAKPTSSVTDEQILACIVSLEDEGRKVTIGGVSEALLVRRNRVQPLLARHRVEVLAARELQARTGPTVAELRAENQSLKQKITEMEAEPTDLQKLRQENRKLKKELKELKAVQKALSLTTTTRRTLNPES